jgi:2-haloacid dehalogenase
MPAPPLAGVAAIAFDAYGTLFDVASAAAAARDELGDRWAPLADLWRVKQLQYTWLRSLMGRHADFRRVTEDSLDFAFEALGPFDGAMRRRLLALYDRLDPYPDAVPVLARLRAGGVRLAILSNGSPAMLDSAVANAGMAPLLDAVLSVEEVGIYKPHPTVYRLACERLGAPADRIGFVSANGWDAAGAKSFGLRVVWCNRAAQPRERLPGAAPDTEIRELGALAALVGLV